MTMHPITKDQENELVHAAQAGSVEARNALVEQYHRAMWHECAKAVGHDLADEYLADGFAGMCTAIRTHDTSKGRLMTLAAMCIRTAIVDAKRRDGGLIRKPRSTRRTSEATKDRKRAAAHPLSLDTERNDRGERWRDALAGPGRAEIPERSLPAWTDKLSPLVREALWLRVYGMTTTQVLRDIGRSASWWSINLDHVRQIARAHGMVA